MKQVLTAAVLASAACVLTGCPNGPGPGTNGTAKTAAKLTTRDFVVAIEQDGRRVMLNDHTARLARRPFTVILVLPRWGGVMVGASHKNDMAAAVRRGAPVSTVLPLPKRGLPEDLGNPRQCVFVTEKGFNYWYYLGESKSSFDQVISAPREFVCKRVVARFAANNDSPAAPLADLPQRDLYLTFVATAWSGGRRVETSAEYVKVTFE